MKERIEKLLEIVEKIESLQVSIDILNSNIRMYPSDFVDLIENDRRSISWELKQIDQLEKEITDISQSLTP